MLMAEGSQGNSFELNLTPEQAPEETQESQQEDAAENQKAAVETVGKGRESAAGKQVAQVYAQPQPPVVADDQTSAAPAKPSEPVTADDIYVSRLPAKDSDLIEKEWVDRAKQIIAKTADDPHRQKHEMSKMKAAYIKKRYNKAVRTDEAPASG